jgi:hypothetical protein
VSKKILSNLAILLSSVVFLLSLPVLAAQDDDQQLTSEERAETHRKRKPEIAERPSIRAALKAMRNNGAMQRASRGQTQVAARSTRINSTTEGAMAVELVSIKHVLTCETDNDCQAAVEWGKNNNFNATNVLTSEGHGGEIMYHLFLRQDISPDEDTITSESSRVHEGVKTLDGIRYATWMVDFDPEGLEDGEGNR